MENDFSIYDTSKLHVVPVVYLFVCVLMCSGEIKKSKNNWFHVNIVKWDCVNAGIGVKAQVFLKSWNYICSGYALAFDNSIGSRIWPKSYIQSMT